MSEKQKLRDQVAELAKAVETLTARLDRQCCHHYNCWHYYQWPTTGAAQVYYPPTITYGTSFSGSIGTG